MADFILNNFEFNQVLLYIIVFVWALKQLSSLFKVDIKHVYQMNNDIKEALNPKCVEIANSFNADRVIFWQFRNGMSFMKHWPDKDMSAIAEYYNPSKHLEFASKFQNVPVRLFDRIIHNLINSNEGIVTIPDEFEFNDTLSVITMTYSMRSIIATFCKNNKGQIVGILMVGWENPNQIKDIDIRQFNIHSYDYYRLIKNVLKKYSLWNRIKFKDKILKS